MDKKRGADWKSWKRLGIKKETNHGELRLVYGVPGTKEIFTVREREVEKQTILGPLSRVSVNILNRKTGYEMPVSYANFAHRTGDVYVDYISTQKEYERRGAASALIAYLKTKKLPINLVSGGDAKEFYRKLGFEKRRWRDVDTELPAEKPLAKREFEKTGRKFVIFAEPRPKPARETRTVLEKARAAFGKLKVRKARAA